MRTRRLVILFFAGTCFLLFATYARAARGGFVGGGSVRSAGGWGDSDYAWNAGFGGAPTPAQLVGNKQISTVNPNANASSWSPSPIENRINVGSIQNSYGSSSQRVSSGSGDNPVWLLVKMSNYLDGLQQLTMAIDMTSEKVTQTGQKVQMSSQQITYAQRPDKLAMDITTDGVLSRMIYDGTGVTVIDVNRKFYGLIPVQGNLDVVLPTLANQYGIGVPAEDLLYKSAYERLQGKVKSAQDLGIERVNGVPCHQAAFMGEKVDFQIWIQTGTEPIPRKVMIIYKGTPGQPRCIMEITRWETGAIPASVFQVTLPPNTQQVKILPIK